MLTINTINWAIPIHQSNIRSISNGVLKYSGEMPIIIPEVRFEYRTETHNED